MMNEIKLDGEVKYPVEFELRVIYAFIEAQNIESSLQKILIDNNASLGNVRSMQSKNPKYGRLACAVRFETKAQMYTTYEQIGKLPGIKAVL